MTGTLTASRPLPELLSQADVENLELNSDALPGVYATDPQYGTT
jgi:hypothetical protein